MNQGQHGLSKVTVDYLNPSSEDINVPIDGEKDLKAHVFKT